MPGRSIPSSKGRSSSERAGGHLVSRGRGVSLRHRRVRRADAPEPADDPALARDHAERLQPGVHRRLAPLRPRRRPGLRARGDGSRRIRGRRRARADRRDPPPPSRARRRPPDEPPWINVSADGDFRPRRRSGARRTPERRPKDDRPNEPVTAAAWITLVSPLAAALAITLAGNRLSRRGAGLLATAATVIAFVAAVVSFVAMLGRDSGERGEVSTAWTWLSAGSFHAGASILVDPLSVMMMLIVTGVGSLIVAYSVGYMDGNDEERRFFAYMSLFVFSMLLLVEGSNLLLLLCGWGMVGLSSYLLIGFDQHRPAAIAAAKKAFVMNAVGDATMALALFLLIQRTGTLGYAQVFANAPGGTAATLIALGLLGGA